MILKWETAVPGDLAKDTTQNARTSVERLIILLLKLLTPSVKWKKKFKKKKLLFLHGTESPLQETRPMDKGELTFSNGSCTCGSSLLIPIEYDILASECQMVM